MANILFLAFTNLQRRVVRTVSLIVAVSIFSIIFFGGNIIVKTLKNSIYNMENRLGADILVIPKGHENEFETILLRGEPNGFYLKKELYEEIKQIKGISKITPQIFLASLDAGCCSSKVQLIGIEESSDFIVKPWLKKKLPKKLENGEIIIGSKVLSSIGDSVKFFNQPFKVVGKTESTGIGFDTSIFMSLETAQDLLRYTNSTNSTDGFDNLISSILIKVDPKFDPKDIINEIDIKHTSEYELDFITSKDIVGNLSKWLNNFSNILYLIAIIFWVFIAIVIFIIYFSMINERKKEIKILRTIGASKQMLTKMLIYETLTTSFIGGFIGVCLSLCVILLFKAMIFQSLGLPYVDLSVLDLVVFFVISLLVSLLIGFLSSIYSIKKITEERSK